MADNTTEQEPSIEEILASIRQIISDDDGGSTPAPKPDPEPVPEAPAEPEPAPAAEDDILELTDRAPDEITIDMQDAAEPEPEPEPLPPPPPVAPSPPKPVPPKAVLAEDDSIFTHTAASAALQGFAKLTSNLAVEKSSHAPGITLEDIVREMLRPMLKDWIDSNLPTMIEKLVEKELDKLARKAMD